MPHATRVDPTPLTPAQLWDLVVAAARELSWGLPEAARATRRWQTRAEAIPDAPIREDALASISTKRGHADGAALFAVLPDGHNAVLLHLLVAYETIWDFLDNVSERHTREANGRELHLALVDALDPRRPLADYYRHHPWSDDGGYLDALVEFCRRSCQALPSYELVRPLLIQEAWRAQVLALNHLTDPVRRDLALERWAANECADDMHEATWFELSGAASASMVIHALLAIAAEPHVDECDIAATYAAYWPWISLATTMLDSYVDRAEDRASGNHSYISHYPSDACAIRRLCYCVARAARDALRLPKGTRHTVIVGCMAAMYLSKDSARVPEMRSSTERLVRAGGSLARLLLPVLRLWRIAYSQRSA
jgi:tetraprenyl-beta-curcumene synthase